LYLVAVGVALTLIDLGCRRLPNVLVLPSYPIMLALLGGASVWQHDGAALARALIGMGALLALYLVLALIHPAGMGFGDVKLAGVLGAALGYLSYLALVIGAFAGFVLGAVLGLALILSRRGSRKSAIPFGPFMIAGALLAVFAAEPLGRGYLRLVTRT
jgi:leader peptidase (prepilin peptidase)/N-methyltransferase